MAGHARHVQRGDGVAAAGHRDKFPSLGALGGIARRFHGGPLERGEFEGAERTVPDQGPGVVDRAFDALHRLRADVEDHAVGGDRVHAVGVGGGVGREMERDDGVDRQDDRAALALGLLHDAPRGVRHVLLDQRLADVDALGVQERVGHRAADHQALHLADQIFEEFDLVETLAPPTMAITGCCGVSSAFDSASSSVCMLRPA